MTGPETDESIWYVFGGLHRLLLRLAGQVPDEWLDLAQTMFDGGDFAYLPDTIASGAAELGIPLTAAEVELLVKMGEIFAPGDPPALLDQVVVVDTPPPNRRRFAHRAGDERPDLVDHKMVGLLRRIDGVAGVRRAWRSPVDDETDPRRVFLVEVDPVAFAWDVAQEARRLLRNTGEDAPQVEVYWTGDPLPDYHQQALAQSTSLWVRGGPPA